jgi:sugar/nucleoside kinase (ribokinase family)
MQPMLVVGSVAFDTIHNHLGTHTRVLGGSAVYGALAARNYSPVRLVGVVGDDFPKSAVETLSKAGIDLEGLEVRKGKTFFWEGEYSKDLVSRKSLATELNVFADFHPKIPERFRDTPYVFLGNIAPELQLEVLEQMRSPKLVIADTMNFWITGKPDELRVVLTRVDVLVINEEEARQLAGVYNIAEVARALLALGPRVVVIKRGEYGALLFEGEQVFSAPAYPCREVRDPTGAGDSFAGGFLGYVAHEGNTSNGTLRRAVIYGSAVASCCVEGVGVECLLDLDRATLDERYQAFRRLAHFE